MKRILLLAILLILYNCTKLPIDNLVISDLSNDEINNSETTKEKIDSDLNKLINDLWRQESGPTNAVRSIKDDNTTKVAIKKKLPSLKKNRSSFSKSLSPDKEYISLNRKKYYNYISQKIYSTNKYGINYKFSIKNKTGETIEKIQIQITTEYFYENSKIIFENKFIIDQNFANNELLKLDRDLVFNYLPNYKPQYFELHQPKKIIFIVKVIASNNVGLSISHISEKRIK